MVFGTFNFFRTDVFD